MLFRYLYWFVPLCVVFSVCCIMCYYLFPCVVLFLLIVLVICTFVCDYLLYLSFVIYVTFIVLWFYCFFLRDGRGPSPAVRGREAAEGDRRPAHLGVAAAPVAPAGLEGHRASVPACWLERELGLDRRETG